MSSLDCDHGRYRANEYFGYCYYIHIENNATEDLWYITILKIAGSTPVVFNPEFYTLMDTYWIRSVGSLEPVTQDYTFIQNCKYS